jgi:hypothetical protein
MNKSLDIFIYQSLNSKESSKSYNYRKTFYLSTKDVRACIVINIKTATGLTA